MEKLEWAKAEKIWHLLLDTDEPRVTCCGKPGINFRQRSPHHPTGLAKVCPTCLQSWNLFKKDGKAVKVSRRQYPMITIKISKNFLMEHPQEYVIQRIMDVVMAEKKQMEGKR